MFPPMTGLAAVSLIPPVTVTGVDDEEGKEVHLATPVSVESESKMEVSMMESVVKMVTPVHKVNRSVEVNVKRPSRLPEDWKFEPKVRTNGAFAGAIDNYYYEPVSGKRFRSKPDVLHFLEMGGRCKRSTGGDATSVCWVLTDSSAETLTPFIHGNMIPEGQRQEWDAVFSTVSQRNANRDAGVSNHRDLIVVDGFLLWRRNRQKVFHLNSVHDVQVWSVIGVVEPVNLKHFTRMDICEKLSQVQAMEAVTNACVGVGCL
ncbi:hypothetical protein FXO38_27703 [Capsicum annuum]|nr:hypothetical protein FXO38_27703 [Capsicum annuum]